MNFTPVACSLAELVGDDYIDAVCEARALLTGEDPAALRRAAREPIDFWPESFQRRLHELLPQTGQQVVAPWKAGPPGRHAGLPPGRQARAGAVFRPGLFPRRRGRPPLGDLQERAFTPPWDTPFPATPSWTAPRWASPGHAQQQPRPHYPPARRSVDPGRQLPDGRRQPRRRAPQRRSLRCSIGC